jgi:hypothetical protein
VASGLAVLGYPNLALYQLGESTLFTQLFNDVKDGSNNLFYPTTVGYDLSTGWGSMNAAALIANVSGSSPGSLATPANVTATPHNQVATISWPAATGATSYVVSRSSSNAGPFTAVTSDVFSTSYTDVGLTNGTTYYYEVESQNVTAHSGTSTPVAVTPTLMAPQAPGNFSAAPVSQ